MTPALSLNIIGLEHEGVLTLTKTTHKASYQL